MGTGIKYLDETWNFIGGCSPCSDGCRECWAADCASKRLKNHPLYKGLTKNGKWIGEIRLCTDIGKADILEQPLHWREPRTIGVQFMGDLFHEKVPFEFIAEVYKTIAFTGWHIYLILTKRINRALEFFKWLENKYTYDGAALMFRGEKTYWQYKPWPLPNIHLGVTICNQAEADEKIPIGLRIPGFDWISFEPLLSDIDMHQSRSRKDIIWRRTHGGSYERRFISRAIIGCESGSHRRKCEPEWIVSIVEQCKAAGVNWLVKQVEINGKVCHDPKRCAEYLGE